MPYKVPPPSRHWYICLKQDETFKQLYKMDYKACLPTSEEGLSKISEYASKHPALKLFIFKELILTVSISSRIEE
jgi:hypothetical protein